ncbi:MAG: hypothetical protein KDK65_04435 [Chlamydiia bacterium]|nr:hypothetical protein [Chlamydiia bacterium]
MPVQIMGMNLGLPQTRDFDVFRKGTTWDKISNGAIYGGVALIGISAIGNGALQNLHVFGHYRIPGTGFSIGLAQRITILPGAFLEPNTCFWISAVGLSLILGGLTIKGIRWCMK